MEYYFQVKIGLSDKRFPSKILLSTPLLDLIPDNEFQIVDVPPTINRMDICGSFSKELGPGICFIKYGNEEWQTYNFCSTVHDNLLISSLRRGSATGNIVITVKLWFPKLCEYNQEEGLQTMDFKELLGTGGVSLAKFSSDITDFYEQTALVDMDYIDYDVYEMNE